MTDGKRDLVAEADAVDAKSDVDGASSMVRALSKGLHRQRTVTKWLIVSLVLDVLLTFGLIYYVRLSHVQTVQIATNQHVSCLSGNAFRKNDRAIWTHILSLPRSTTQTYAQVKAQAATTAELGKYLDRAFKLRVCP